MMTFGQDQVVVSPLKDLYDTNIMQMAIAAAKDMYDKNYADMKEFAKTYGDFVSPIGNYTQQYYDMSKGLVNKKIDELYARGIDPLRSAQGRAEIQKIINSVDVGRLNQMKAETEAAKEYVKNRAKMQAENRYNPEFEKWMLGGRTLETWDGSQPWTATSPYLYQDLNEYTGHIFDKMQDEYISSDGQYDYTGVSEERRRAALTPQLAGIISTPLGQYHLELAKQDAAIKYGRVPTDAEVMQQFQDNIITSTKEYERRNRTENKEYGRRREFDYSNALDANRQARADMYDQRKEQRDLNSYMIKEGADLDGNGKVDQNERAAWSQMKFVANANKGKGSGSKGSGSGGSSDDGGYSTINANYFTGLQNILKQHYSSIQDENGNQIPITAATPQQLMMAVDKYGNNAQYQLITRNSKNGVVNLRNVFNNLSTKEPMSSAISRYAGRINSDGNIECQKTDIGNMFTREQVAAFTRGIKMKRADNFTGKNHNKALQEHLGDNLYSAIRNGDATMIPVDGEHVLYTARMNDGRIHQYRKFYVSVDKEDGSKETATVWLRYDTRSNSGSSALDTSGIPSYRDTDADYIERTKGPSKPNTGLTE